MAHHHMQTYLGDRPRTCTCTQIWGAITPPPPCPLHQRHFYRCTCGCASCCQCPWRPCPCPCRPPAQQFPAPDTIGELVAGPVTVTTFVDGKPQGAYDLHTLSFRTQGAYAH